MDFLRSATTNFMLGEYLKSTPSNRTIGSLCDWVLRTYNLTPDAENHLDASSRLIIELSTELMVDVDKLLPTLCGNLASNIYSLALDLKRVLEEWRIALGVAASAQRKEAEKLRSDLCVALKKFEQMCRGFSFSSWLSKETPSSESARADIGIITIITEETQAVLAGLDAAEKVEGSVTRRILYRGSLPREDGGKHSVVCTQCLEQANRSVISAYNDLVEESRPTLVVLLGIAGSIHKDIGACDVVFGDQVFYYDKRKIIENRTKRRGEGYKIPPWLGAQLNAFFVAHGEPAQLKASTGSPATSFKVWKGPIGSGEAVVAFRDASERKWLTEINDKTLVLETEAGGVAQAYYEDEIHRQYRAGGYLVVRGVSDLADQAKDDRWRRAAPDNAMIALREFALGLPNLNDFLRKEAGLRQSG